MPASSSLSVYAELLDHFAQNNTPNFQGTSGKGGVYDVFLRIEQVRQSLDQEEREILYEAFVSWTKEQLDEGRDILCTLSPASPSIVQAFVFYSHECLSIVGSRLCQLKRNKKRKRIAQEVKESNKRSKLSIEVDPSLLLDIVFGGKSFVIHSDLLANIFSFLPHEFTSGSNVMNVRLVNKLFCFAYHQTSAVWMMPHKLLLTPVGLFNGDFSLGWCCRLFLHTLYRTTDEKEKAALLKRKTHFQKLVLEGREVTTRSTTTFKRLVKMATLIRVPVPVELVNRKCELFIHSFTSQTTFNAWLELSHTGQSILNTTCFALDPTNGYLPWATLQTKLDMCYLDWDHQMLQADRLDMKRVLASINTRATTLRIEAQFSDLMMLVGDLVFASVRHLYTKTNVIHDSQTERNFPNLMGFRYVLTDEGRATLNKGVLPTVRVWDAIPKNGIRKSDLLGQATDQAEQIRAYRELMNKDLLILRENQENELIVYRNVHSKSRMPRDPLYRNLCWIADRPTEAARRLEHWTIVLLMSRNLVKKEKYRIFPHCSEAKLATA